MAISSNKIIRILIVDDSAFMRKAISMMLEEDPQIKIIGTARNGKEGVDKALELKPDLITMDIEMPQMDGLTALKQIMETSPTLVMMLSSLTTDGASATLDALELGAVDFIPKQLSFVSLDIVKIKEELLRKIKDIVSRKNVLMAQYRSKKFTKLKSPEKAENKFDNKKTASVSISKSLATPKRSHSISVIAIGSSTGGPPALQAVIPKLPRSLPVGVVIAQHMPPNFTKSMAERLNSLSQVTVKEAHGGEEITPGTVFIAPGGQHLTVRKNGNRAYTVVSSSPKDALYKPCVDVMLDSVANAYGRFGMGVILTGMGNNGVVGMRNLKSKGGIVIAQNEETCIVYGMPRAVIEAKIANHISPIDNISNEIISYF
ncbi:MAG: chemotaxis response regulator protein-glutamate methylesterase [candidate division Zixibacteria bacterium]|nr:chemotaxis response regulator protein-glutamate methylesterase [candidate division Zixibacteria bacterium]